MLRQVLCAILMAVPLSAAEPFYIGKWKIVSAEVAPWWEDASRKPDAAGIRTLVGKTVTIKAKTIKGPRILACKRTQYKVTDYPADFLFQGAFGEMQRRNKSADPGKVAAKLGFRGSSWKTLETGCEAEIDYHFIDSTTAAIGLDNYVYTLKKQ
jgi:hypothetical protein